MFSGMVAQMEQISKVGQRWLRRNHISKGELPYVGRTSSKGNRYIDRPRCDPRRFHPQPPNVQHDVLRKRDNTWILEMRHREVEYKEYADGKAELMINGVELPELACGQLLDSNRPLEDVISFTKQSLFHGFKAVITGAEMEDEGLRLFLRVPFIDLLSRR